VAEKVAMLVHGAALDRQIRVPQRGESPAPGFSETPRTAY
jgi:hypothetical protein